MHTDANQPISTRRALSRRFFLQGAGALLGLPLLDAMIPAFARSATAASLTGGHRFLGICNNLGLLPENFFPQTPGPDYTPSPYMQILAEHRKDFTVFSGVSHPDVDGGHPADICFLTAAPHPGRGGFRNTISLDQFAAERIGHLTRFPSLTLGVNVQQGSHSLSWTGSGVLIPCEEKASLVFKKLFVSGTKREMELQLRRLELGHSILDSVADQAKGLQKKLGPRDRDRMDQYFTSVRELERNMEMAREWETRPKPVIAALPPTDPESARQYMEKTRLMYDMAFLAFQTDSTRMITLMLDSVNSPTIEVDDAQISDSYHNLSHHGKSKSKVGQLTAIDSAHMKLLAELFTKLKGVSEAQDTLLDRTAILYGSNLGNANTHVTTNLPVLLAGGGFKHAGHLAFDTNRNYPLPNIFVSLLQRWGMDVDQFASSTGTMRGLELAS